MTQPWKWGTADVEGKAQSVSGLFSTTSSMEQKP